MDDRTPFTEAPFNEAPFTEAPFTEKSRAGAAQARGAKLRAASDMGLMLLGTVGAALLGSTPHQQLMAGTAALSLGILIFVIRRGRDLEKLARHNRWRDEAVVGRGIPLSSWRGGTVLASWDERREAGVREVA